ncbi:hypothetical protein [Cryobacterium tagatosivorans]|uniref:Uncharacterized protein n=1 Tax=Cryobacterium tagatosivorans TaxID=1259199 RepID=A0A4R8UEC1_9MICO|nr:hypothetical protein [Cryobacterium tagatosivorans]TFB50252.1 hypothetical protein E3O23_10180 [Cryobacterium tagatosivorans]
MSRFDARPDREELSEALNGTAKQGGDRLPMVGSSLFEAYEALDWIESHLTDWTRGPFRFNRKNKEPDNGGAAHILSAEESSAPEPQDSRAHSEDARTSEPSDE